MADDFAKKDNPVLIHLSRSQPHLQEEVIVKSVNGFDYILTTSNSLSQKNTEIGVYKKKGIYLFAKAKQFSTTVKTDSPKDVAMGSPHDWRLKVFGKDVKKTDPAYSDVFKTLQFELKNLNKWTPVKTVHGKFEKSQVVFTHFDGRLNTKRSEKLPVAKACQFINGHFLCRTDQGAILVSI